MNKHMARRIESMENALNPPRTGITWIVIYYGDEPHERFSLPSGPSEYWNPETQEWQNTEYKAE